MKAVSYNIEYLCQKMSDMSGLPIRIYRNNVIDKTFSVIPFIKDPIELHLDQLLQLQDHISYYISEYSNYYGVVNSDDLKIILGPSSLTDYSNQDLHKMAFDLNINNTDYDDFSKAMKVIVHMPLDSIIQMMCTINHILNNEELNLSDLQVNKEYSYHRNQNEYVLEESDIQKSFNIEKEIIRIVKSGDTDTLDKWAKQAPTVKSGTLSDNLLRQTKNTFIVTTTLISRSAIEEGMNVKDSFKLSDYYIQKCENTNNLQDLLALQYEMIRRYTQEIGYIKQLTYNNKLTNDVYSYIINHLSDSIKVEDIAKALYTSRSHLSTIFKKETNENISDYIHKVKIEKAKELLQDNSKNILLISDYLGYSSSSHFNRIFKKYTKISPKQYRIKQL